MAMKKSVIKRRKRVVPAAQGSQGIDAANNSTGSPDSDPPSPPAESQRGSLNPDGSVNLGFRMRNDQGRALLPDPTSSSRGQNGQMPNTDLTAYASTANAHAQEHLGSLNNDNRLPPMNSYPSPTQQRPSLSPNSFLSPSRKRSFSSAEIELLPSINNAAEASANPKRLSSIKSILNPGFSEADGAERSPGRYPGMGSARNSSGYLTSPPNSQGGSALSSARDSQSESERAKVERREMLQREAEKMREALKAKERELAELGGE